jgi:hypothetical protein
MPIKVGRTQRRKATPTPLLEAPSTAGFDAVAAGTQRGIQRLERGIASVAQGAQALGEGLERRQERIDTVSALEAENNISQEANQLLITLKANNQGSLSKNVPDEYATKYQEIESKWTRELSPGANERIRANLQRNRARANLDISAFTADQMNKAEVEARQNKLNNAENMVFNNPIFANYATSRNDLNEDLNEARIPPETREAMSQAIDDSLGAAFFMGKQPQTALAEFEAMKDGKAPAAISPVYDNMSADAKAKTEKELRLREKAFKQAKKQEDIETDNQLILDAQKQVYTSPEVAQAATPAGARALEKINRDKGKETKAAVKDEQYLETSTWLRLNDNPANITNAEIIERVDNPKDQEHFIAVRDQYKKAALSNVEYKNMLKNLDDDFGANKFGKGSKGRREYREQLETFERYMLETPDANAREYYDRLMEPINAKLYDNFSWGTDTDISPEDFAIAREIEEVILDTTTENRDRKREYLKAAKSANPDYTIAELSVHYDTNVAGR